MPYKRKDPDKRKDSDRWFVSLRTPGWKRKRFIRALPKGINAKAALRFEKSLREIISSRDWIVLDQIVSGKVSIPQVIRVKSSGGEDGLRDLAEKVAAGEKGARLFDEELVDEFLTTSGIRASDAQQLRYRRQLIAYREYLLTNVANGEEGDVTVALIADPNVARAWVSYTLRERKRQARAKSARKHAMKLGDVTEKDLDPGVVDGIKKTVNRRFAPVRSMARWLNDLGEVDGYRLRRSAIEGFTEKSNQLIAFSADEIETLLRVASQIDAERECDGYPFPDRLFWAVLAATGALVHKECTEQIRLSSIQTYQNDPGEARLHIRGTKNANRTRDVPIPVELVYELRRHAERFGLGPENLLLFGRPREGKSGPRHRPFRQHLTASAWKNLTARIIEVRRQEGASPEEIQRWKDSKAQFLRHSFGRMLVEAGLDLKEIAEYMGHGNNIQTTQKYLLYRPTASTAKVIDAHRKRGIGVAPSDEAAPTSLVADQEGDPGVSASKIAEMIRRSGISLGEIESALGEEER